jgi:vitamin B12 transporter
MNRPTFALMATLCAAPAMALEGRVVLKDGGGPIADAEVSVLGRPGSVRTAADGRFVLTPDPQPPFELLVVLPGGRYLPLIRVETVSAGPLQVEATWTREESITVTAGTTPTTEGAPANGLTLLSAREIAWRAPTHLAQAVENVAGASTVSEGQAAVPALRGFARGRTLILVDGARVSAERRVGPSAAYIDPAAVEAIEVSRGPGAVAYGSDAFGGVLHVRTRRAEPGRPFGGRFDGGIGAGAPQQRAALELTKGFDRGGVLVLGHVRNFEDWTSPEGEVFNSGAEDRGVLVRVDHQLGGGLFSAGWQSDFGREIERPRNNSRTVRFFYPTEDSHRLTLSWERGPGETLSRLGVNAFMGHYAQVTDQDRFASVPRTVERADISARDFHVRGFAGTVVGTARVEAGVDVNGRVGLEALDVGLTYDASGTLARTTTNVSIEDARRVDAGVYAMADLPAGDALVLAGGLRADRVSTRNRGGFFGDRSTSEGALSGFAAATAGPFSGFSATAQVARGFRDPVLSDRYFRGPTGRGFITGNPDLEAETSLQLDLALRYSRARWKAAVYGFTYRIDDLSERFQTETDFFFFRNRGRARMRGVEAEVQALLPARLTVEATAHLLQGKALDDDGALDDVPPGTVTLRLLRHFDRGSVWVRAAGYGRLDEPGPNEQARPGYGLLDAGGALRLVRQVELTVIGRNLLDKVYLVSPDARAVLAAGRSGLVTASVRF